MVWSGLGISTAQPDGTWSEFNNMTDAQRQAIMDQLLPYATEFPRLRIVSQSAFGTSQTASHYWALAVKKYKPSTYIHYGVANGASVYLPTFYSTYLAAMLVELAWARDNGMNEFQVANEFEINGQAGTTPISSITRSGGVVTVVTTNPHNLQTGDDVSVGNTIVPSDMGAFNLACTVINSTTLTYLKAGADGSGSGADLKAGERTIIRFIKMLAVAGRAIAPSMIFTYSVSQGHEQFWVDGDVVPGVGLDTIGLDIYGDTGFDNFVALTSAMYAIFGSRMIVSEFNVHSAWGSSRVRGMAPTSRGFDVAYSDEIYRRMKYLQNLGIQQAYFFAAWNASSGSSANNNFTVFYNINPTTGSRLIGNWKAGRDRLLEKRVSKAFVGTQQGT